MDGERRDHRTNHEQEKTSHGFTRLVAPACPSRRLCLGTMNFGPQTDEADSHAIMDAALDAGINFFDTANVYGWGESKGRTEEIIGSWFATGRRPPRQGRARHQGLRHADEATWPNDEQAVRAEHPPRRRRQPQAAADRLHRPLPVPPHRPRHAVGGDLAGDRRPGPAGQDPLRRLAATSPAGRSPRPTRPPRSATSLGLVSEQCLYNLLERRAEMEVIPAAQEYGLGVIPWSPLHGGLLGGVHQEGRPRAARRTEGRAADALETHRRADPGVRGSAATSSARARRGRAGLAAAPGPASPGRSSARAPRSSSTSALRAVELELTRRCWPGSTRSSPATRPAPEDYAW